MLCSKYCFAVQNQKANTKDTMQKENSSKTVFWKMNLMQYSETKQNQDWHIVNHIDKS